MRHLAAAASLFALLGLASSGLAQDGDSDSSSDSEKAYEFEAKKVEVDRKEPQGDRQAGEADFGKVREIDKKSFMGGDGTDSSDQNGESESSEESDDSDE